jgi:FMN phosphatase YigB (HAD superfamily)
MNEATLSVKALFFDLDGTLTDIDRREVEVIYDTVTHFGLKTSKRKVKELCFQTPSYVEVFKELGFELAGDAVEYWTAAFVNGYHIAVVRRGVEPTLKGLSKKYRLACVTSRETCKEVIQELSYLGLGRFFNHIVTRNVAAKHLGGSSIPFFPFHGQRRKLYECALTIAERSPDCVVAIGDMGRELKPAKELGMITVGLVTNKAKLKELRESSDFLIPSMSRLDSVLAELNKSCQL